VKKDANGALSLQQEWKVRNFQAGLELFKRIGEIAEAEGHHPDLHLEGFNRVAADLSTHSVGRNMSPSAVNLLVLHFPF
jgi:4a-hydroxytetrahydrobiopterin dehydratase